MRYIVTSPDKVCCHEMFCCIWVLLVTILTDYTGSLFRPLMTPGLCGAEQELSILSERM